MLLEKTFIIENLTTYSRNVRSEILKTPKVYFTDLGMRNNLLALNSISQIEKLGQYVTIFENSIVEKLNTIMPFMEHEPGFTTGKPRQKKKSISLHTHRRGSCR